MSRRRVPRRAEHSRVIPNVVRDRVMRRYIEIVKPTLAGPIPRSARDDNRRVPLTLVLAPLTLVLVPLTPFQLY